jgi:hypothetical protein
MPDVTTKRLNKHPYSIFLKLKLQYKNKSGAMGCNVFIYEADLYIARNKMELGLDEPRIPVFFDNLILIKFHMY